MLISFKSRSTAAHGSAGGKGLPKSFHCTQAGVPRARSVGAPSSENSTAQSAQRAISRYPIGPLGGSYPGHAAPIVPARYSPDSARMNFHSILHQNDPRSP